jgi:hypothetical protein
MKAPSGRAPTVKDRRVFLGIFFSAAPGLRCLRFGTTNARPQRCHDSKARPRRRRIMVPSLSGEIFPDAV